MTEKIQQSPDEFGEVPAISASELAALGAADVAYAKLVMDADGQNYWSIHAGDGTQLGAAQSLDPGLGRHPPERPGAGQRPLIRPQGTG